MNKFVLFSVSLVMAMRAFGGDTMIDLDLPNLRQPQQSRIVSGAIDAADIGRLRADGVRRLINLRTPEESQGLDEAPLASGLGIEYRSIPIQDAESLTLENARKLDAALSAAGNQVTQAVGRVTSCCRELNRPRGYRFERLIGATFERPAFSASR